MGIYIDNVDLDEWMKANARTVDAELWESQAPLVAEVRLCEFREPYHSVLVCWTTREVQRALPWEKDQRPRGYYLANSAAVIENIGPAMVSAMKQDLAQGLTEGDLLFSSIEPTS